MKPTQPISPEVYAVSDEARSQLERKIDMNYENAWMWVAENAPQDVVEALEKEIDFLDGCRLTLEHLTPGGSEYYRNPEGCEEVIRWQRTREFELLKKGAVARKKLEAEKKKLIEAYEAGLARSAGRVGELLREREELEKLVVEVAELNWLDEDAEEDVPADVQKAVIKCRNTVEKGL